MPSGYDAVTAEHFRGTAERQARGVSQTTVRDVLLAALTFSSGAVDAIAFLGLGKVFTAFQTGNLVFLGIGLAGSGGPSLLRVGASLVGFALGVALATRLVRRSKGSRLWPSRVSLALAYVCLTQLVFAVLWVVTSGRPGALSGHALAALSGLAMGLQSGAVLSLGVTGVFTTAATATVMFLMRDEAERQASPADRARLVRVLLALVAGAAAGGLLLAHARSWAALLPPTATAAVIAAAHQLIARAR